MQESKRDTDVNNSLLDSVGEGKGGMIWENSIETCILPYVKWIASPGLMPETGCSGLVHWDDPEGWDGEGGGRGLQDGGHMCTHGWFMWIYGKNHYNIVISFQLKWISLIIIKKNLPASAGDERDESSMPRLGRSPGEGAGNLLQYSCLENPMDGGEWWATVHGVARSQTWLSN